MQDKCQHHDDLKSEVSAMGDLARQHLSWQAGFEARMDALVEGIRQNNESQKEMQKCLNALTVNLAENYVGKREFTDYCRDAEQRTVRIHERLDAFHEDQKKSLWKIIGLFVPVSALVFSFVTWLLGILGMM